MAFVAIDKADISGFICEVLKQIVDGVKQANEAGITCHTPRTVDFDLSVSVENGPIGQVKFIVPLEVEKYMVIDFKGKR